MNPASDRREEKRQEHQAAGGMALSSGEVERMDGWEGREDQRIHVDCFCSKGWTTPQFGWSGEK